MKPAGSKSYWESGSTPSSFESCLRKASMSFWYGAVKVIFSPVVGCVNVIL